MLNILRDRELYSCAEGRLRKCLSMDVQFLQRMELQRKLRGHSGCVNTVSFDTEGGNVLISGSDDQNIILWDWQAGTKRLTFDSGHHNNVFQARMMPHSSGGRIVTCAADGQVRLAELPQGVASESVQTSLLGQHGGRAHKLALDLLNPGNCFYSCGEDGQVMHFDLRCCTGTQSSGGGSSSSSSRNSGRRKLLICRGYSHARGPNNKVVGINAIHCNPARPWQFAVGGCDSWARVYDCRRTRDTASTSVGPPTREQAQDARIYQLSDEPVARLCPKHMWRSRGSGAFSGGPNITCVMFSKQGELVATYNDEDIYLFGSEATNGCLSSSSDGSSHREQQQQQHSISQGEASSSSGSGKQQLSPSRRRRGELGGNGTAAAAGGSHGYVDAPASQQQQQQQAAADYEQRPRWRRRQLLRSDHTAAAAAGAPSAAAAAPAPAGEISIADLNELDDDIEAQLHPQQQQQQRPAAAAAATAGSAHSSSGHGIPAARFYDRDSYIKDGVVATYYGHRNAATVKGVSFFGDNDEYIVSGSDCGHVYIWNKYNGEIIWCQQADDEVVNCLEPHPYLPHVLATSGIEHDIKIWAPTADQPGFPNPLTMQRLMSSNKQDRDAGRDVLAQPEQWLMQLLAAQRRREIARQRARQDAAAAAATTAAGAAAQENRSGQEVQVTNYAESDNNDEEEEGDDFEQSFIRVLRPGVVQVRLNDLAARRRPRRGGGSDDENDNVTNDEDDEGVSSGEGDGDERPCYIS